MADSPVRTLVKIGDPTTAANEAAVNASGELTVVEADAAAIKTAVELIDDAIFVDDTATHATGTTKGIGIMAVAVPTDAAISANDIGMPAMSLDRRLHVDADITASVALDVSAATVTVDGTGTFVVQIDGDALAALQLIDDPVAVLGTATYLEATTKGMIIGAVRNDSLAALVNTDNEIAPLQVDASGSLYVTGGGGGTEYTEDAPAPADPVGSTVMIKRDDVIASSPVTAADDFMGMLGTEEGALWVQDFNSDAILADTASMNTDLGTLAGAVAGSEMQVDLIASTLDLMLGSDFSNVLGTVSLITTTQADNLADTLDGLQATAFGYMYDGAAWDRVRGDATDGLLVNLGTNNDVSFTPSTLSGEVAVRATSTDVAVDATLDVDEADTGATTSFCVGFDASASVPIKAELQHVTDGAGTAVVTLFATAGEPIHWRAPHRDYFEKLFTANAGFDGWRVVVTNKDSSDAADLYGTIYTEN